ncbi:MAG: hypothetical protein QXP60_09210 [Nitrososphaerota archaeon]
MKKILICLIILWLIGIIGLNGVNKKVIYSKSADIFLEIPLSIFSREPAESFLIPIIIINKSELDKKIIEVEFYKEDGSLIFKKKIDEIIKGANIKLSDDEIRDKIGLVIPDRNIIDKAYNLLKESKLLKKGDERNKKVELSWYLLSMNYKEKVVDEYERREILKNLKILSYELSIKDLNLKLIPPDFINIKIKFTCLNSDNSFTSIEKQTTLFYLTSLPSQYGWYPGDGHMHTKYSDGLYSILQRRNQAYNSGLKWIIITDHGWNKLINNWSQYKTDCTNAQNQTPNITVCPGEEIATSENSHYLSYMMDNISTPFRDLDYNKYWTIYWILRSELLGFIAHPYSTPYPWEDWDDYYVTYNNSRKNAPRGIELISYNYIIEDDKIQCWDNYLTTYISNTMADTNHRFCVGLGNSDDHILTIGYNMTYIYTGSSQPPGTYRTAVYNAIERGRATVSSDGSLLIHKITTGGTYLPGYYMQKSSAGYVTVNVYAKRVISTCEWVEIKLIISNGTQIYDYIYNQYEINKNYSIYLSQDTYVRAQITFCHYVDGVSFYSYCFSNPIFIDFPPYGQ